MSTVRTKLSILAVAAAATLGGCGGGSGNLALTALNLYSPAYDNLACQPGSDSIGTWKMVSNNTVAIPDSPDVLFFSYNQPSINNSGMVTFRGRARDSSVGSSGGNSGSSGSSAVQSGIYAAQPCLTKFTLYTAADSNMVVPDPNTSGTVFTEFPSIPRIDMASGVLATRGMSQPLLTLPDGTKLGTSGVYVTLNSGLTTAIGLFGTVTDYAYMQVPNATSTTPIRFDQFPGSPAVAGTGGKYVLFKGNYTDADSTGALTVSKTGVYYRDVSTPKSAVAVIADTNMMIPGTSTAFGSTAPPSAAGNQVVFTGLDNEGAPTAGGIFLAPIASKPALTALVKIGDPVPDSTGTALTDGSTFNQFGEGLSFDGRYVSFWGAWGTNGVRTRTLACPTDGNKDMIAACNAQSNAGPGLTTVTETVDQGIFVYDTQLGKLWMAARTTPPSTPPSAAVGQFQNFIFWTFSGNPKTVDGEPPRWRSSAFAAMDGNRGVLFKGSVSNVAGTSTTPGSGIYGSQLLTGQAGMGPVFKVLAEGDDMATVDPSAPAASAITSLGIERESLRSGWFSLTVSSLNAASESWAGVYATYFPGQFKLTTTADAYGMYNLKLGN
ncbi:MAG: hypothetical protein KGM40_00350 [Betaproteobacteria bacterium]|nr:hypothetical protein [Betaproteobacteria bacterium]